MSYAGLWRQRNSRLYVQLPGWCDVGSSLVKLYVVHAKQSSNTGVLDCAGECNGTAVKDCAGDCNGAAVLDCAGDCSGGTTVDCAGVLTKLSDAA
eukprot:SAG11_NODE_835_length_6927_cov_2.877142_2_plen_95_part_00